MCEIAVTLVPPRLLNDKAAAQAPPLNRRTFRPCAHKPWQAVFACVLRASRHGYVIASSVHDLSPYETGCTGVSFANSSLLETSLHNKNKSPSLSRWTHVNVVSV